MEGLRVLIVEDDVIYAEAVKSLLEREGHAVVGIAVNAAEACTLATSGPLDLAFVDLRLRDGFTGPEIGRRLALHGTAVMFLTGAPDYAPHEGRGVLTKPAGDVRLIRAVAAVIASIRPPDA